MSTSNRKNHKVDISPGLGHRFVTRMHFQLNHWLTQDSFEGFPSKCCSATMLLSRGVVQATAQVSVTANRWPVLKKLSDRQGM